MQVHEEVAMKNVIPSCDNPKEKVTCSYHTHGKNVKSKK